MNSLQIRKAEVKLFSTAALVRVGRIAALAVSALAITPGAASACWMCLDGHGCRELGRHCADYNQPIPSNMSCTDKYIAAPRGNNSTTTPSIMDAKAVFLLDEQRNPNARSKK